MYKYYVTFCFSVSNVSTLKDSSLRMRVNFFHDVFISFLLKVHAKLTVCSYTCLYCRYMQYYILFKSCFCLQQFLQMYCIGFVYLSTWFMCSCTYICISIVIMLSLSQTSPGFYVSTLQVFRKHCGKRRNCS